MKKKHPYFRDTGFWALILGGSSGIGLATAKKMAETGMNICVVHRDRRQQLSALQEEFAYIRAQGVRLLSFNTDALRADNRASVIEQLKANFKPNEQLRLLVHAITRGNLKLIAPFKQSRTTDFDEVIEHMDHAADLYRRLEEQLQAPHRDTNSSLNSKDLELTLQAMALSLYDWVDDLFRHQLFASDARIIGLTSEGSRRAWPSYAAVSAAKAALEAICRSIALEFAPHGIRCNVVQAGVTDTPSLRLIPGSDHLKLNALLRNPFSRLTTPEDVANAIYLLTREESAWINGAIIPVDGGEKNS